jgi:D-apionate oxidoisomerase
MSTVALVGAGGKMGCRITDNMKKQSTYRMLHVEVAPAGLAHLEKRGVAAVTAAEAVPAADFVVLAVPDNRVEAISAQVVPLMKPGASLVHLDPAAPCAGRVFGRADVAYFVTHPCHPPVFNDETDLEAKRDFFGGVKAKQHIVCALLQGTEADYERGVALCTALFHPVIQAHRVSVEQMAILEPALAETTSAPAVMLIKEGLDEAVRRGVPPAAARAFLMGHINIQLAITFGEIDARYSDGALKMLAEAQSALFKPDWKKVFEPEAVRAQLESILEPPAAQEQGKPR